MLLRLAATGAALALLLTGCSGTQDVQAQDPGPTPKSESPASGTTGDAAPACTYTPSGMEPAKPVEAPPAEPATDGAVTAELALNVGTLTVELDADTAPCTVNSFLALAEQGFYDDTQCHRLTTQGIFVLQCGDPTATGTGGPGYQYDDELSGAESYGPGTVAMANAGPDTNGSQFFIVYGDSPLPPAYTVFGALDEESLALVEKIADRGTATGTPDGPPRKKVLIQTVSAG